MWKLVGAHQALCVHTSACFSKSIYCGITYFTGGEYSRNLKSRGKYTSHASHSSATLPSSLLYVLGIAVVARPKWNSELGYNRDEHCISTEI